MSPKIVIIGAGISGISVAERLIKQGFDNILLLEANDRIGGRIQTREIGEGWVEQGAQWIHGEDDNVVYEYAKKHGLLSDRHGSYELTDELFHTEDGGTIEPLLCAHLCEVLSCKLEHDDVSKDKRYDANRTSIDRYLEEELRDEFSRSGSKEEEHLKKAFLKWYKRFQCSIEGCDSLSELSLSSFVHYKECEGNPLTNLKRGYTALVESLAAGIPKANILLRKPVDHVEIVSKRGRHAVEISCRDGSRYEADHVVVTVSLGILKSNADKMFEPPLSLEKQEAIKKIGFGTVNKVFLEFERPFWPPGSPGYSLVWTGDVEMDWSKAIFGFYTVPFAPNVLCGWLSGKEAREMETFSDEEVKETCSQLLKRFTGRAELPNIKSIIRSGWYSNPFTKGSYSYLKSELPDPKVANEVLAEPIYMAKDTKQCPVIMFAGEATHPYYFSTVHGAMETGMREANRIIDFHSAPNPKL